jgi:hypothetical protein
LLVFGFIYANSINAQSNSEYSIGVSIASSISLISGKGWNEYLDSSNSNQVFKTNLHIHAWFNKSISKEMDLQVGLGYANIGFQRAQKSLRFKDYTYPGIATGMVEDFSNTEKQLDYYYQFQYLQIPMLLNMQVGRSKDFKYRYSFSTGLTLNTLIKHKLIAETISGYYIDGNERFVLDSTGFNARRFSLQVQLGMKADFKIDKKTRGFVQPLLAFYPISISSGDRKINPLLLIINFGINYSFLE